MVCERDRAIIEPSLASWNEYIEVGMKHVFSIISKDDFLYERKVLMRRKELMDKLCVNDATNDPEEKLTLEEAELIFSEELLLEEEELPSEEEN